MKKGICPKCGAVSVYRSQDGIGSAEFHFIRKGGFGGSSTAFDCYLCTACGYFENYVSNREHLENIEKKGFWARVAP